MSFVSAGDIAKLGKILFRLWEYGFSKCKNAEKQYADFGSDIHYLAGNLEKLHKVIQDVTLQIPRTLSPEGHAWDLKSLLKICGDFRKTIRECERLLDDRSKFGRGEGGFVYNVQWNLVIEPEVSRLRDRVAFHNIKIATVLKPLETKLMLDLKDDIYRAHGDLASRITDVHQTLLEAREVLRRIEGHWTTNAQEASTQAQTSPPEIPRVPEDLEIRFEVAVKASNPELGNEKQFPFYEGLNAFHHHFEQSTILFKPDETPTGDFFAERTPKPGQYLNLMKSAWIIKKIKKGDEWAEASSDRLSECYMKELEDRCLHELSRFTREEPGRKKLAEPDKRNIRLLPEEEFRIWLDDDECEDDFRSPADSLNEILRVPLLSTTRNRKQDLILIRQSEVKLQMQRLSSRTTGAPNRDITRELINLERAHYDPLYANPRASPEAFNVVFRGDEGTAEDIALSFGRLTDLLDFQQAITGYKVVFDILDVKTLSYQASGWFSGKKTAEFGRLQIWNPRRLERRVPQTLFSGIRSSRHRPSVITRSSTALSVAKTFSTAHTSPVENKDTTSFNFELPGLPIIVLFLQTEKSEDDEMTFLDIKLDKKTTVKGTCGCDRSKQMCIHSTISRSRGLLARRISASNGHVVNLAKLGLPQASNIPEYERKLRWLHIEFKSQDDRVRFEHG